MIYLIHGDEEFLRAEALAEIKTALGPPEFAQLNTAELDGARFSRADLHHACDAMPFLAPRRLVILNGALTAFARKAQRGQGKGRGQADAAGVRSAEDAGPSAGEGGEALPAAAKELRGALIAYLAIQLVVGGSGGVIPPQVMGVLFGAVAGIMVYISLDELLPTSRAYGKDHDSILGLVAGMFVMAVSMLLLG